MYEGMPEKDERQMVKGQVTQSNKRHESCEKTWHIKAQLFQPLGKPYEYRFFKYKHLLCFMVK